MPMLSKYVIQWKWKSLHFFFRFDCSCVKLQPACDNALLLFLDAKNDLAHIILCWCRGLKNILRLYIKKVNCSEWELVPMPSRQVVDFFYIKQDTAKSLKDHWNIPVICCHLYANFSHSLGMSFWQLNLCLYIAMTGFDGIQYGSQTLAFISLTIFLCCKCPIYNWHCFNRHTSCTCQFTTSVE